MGAHQIELQLSDLVAGDANIGEFSYPGRDRVRHTIFRDQRVHDGASAIDSFTGVGIKQDRAPPNRDFSHRFDSEVFAADV